jgi:hypothetical protein
MSLMILPFTAPTQFLDDLKRNLTMIAKLMRPTQREQVKLKENPKVSETIWGDSPKNRIPQQQGESRRLILHTQLVTTPTHQPFE